MAGFIAQNIKYFRRKAGFTQEQFAAKLDIKRSLLGAYEEARATPKLEVLTQMTDLFGVTIAELLNHNLVPEGAMALVGDKRGRPKGSGPKIAPLIKEEVQPVQLLRGVANDAGTKNDSGTTATENYLTGQTLRTLTVQATEAEWPVGAYVGAAQLAAYASQCQQAAYVAGLPLMTLPFAAAGQVYRAFELLEGTIVIARYVRNWYLVNADATYVLVSAGQVVAGEVDNRLADEGTIRLNRIHYHQAKTRQKARQAYTGADLTEVWAVEWVMQRAVAARALQEADVDDRLSRIEEKLAKLAN